MKTYRFTEEIQKNASASHHFVGLNKEIVDALEKKDKTRLLCVVDDRISYSCAIKKNRFGEYLLMISVGNLKKIKKTQGDQVTFEVCQHPNPLGVDVPEVLEVFLSQEPEAKVLYDSFTDGRKRTLIFHILRVKDVDKQVQRIIDFLAEERIKRIEKSSFR